MSNSAHSKELIEDIDKQIQDLKTQRDKLMTEMYEDDIQESVKHLLGKTVKLPGYYYYDTNESFDINNEYRLLKIDKYISPVDKFTAYFKVSNAIYVRKGNSEEGFNIEFINKYSCSNYKIEDLDKIAVLTEEQAKKEYLKIHDMVNKKFDKVKI